MLSQQPEQSGMTKNIKVSDELAKRLASHGGFHSTYAQIIEMLLDFYENNQEQRKNKDEKEE
jgi:nitrate reductase assembly molybdenum cofactor insertion protein NarJ